MSIETILASGVTEVETLAKDAGATAIKLVVSPSALPADIEAQYAKLKATFGADVNVVIEVEHEVASKVAAAVGFAKTVETQVAPIVTATASLAAQGAATAPSVIAEVETVAAKVNAVASPILAGVAAATPTVMTPIVAEIAAALPPSVVADVTAASAAIGKINASLAGMEPIAAADITKINAALAVDVPVVAADTKAVITGAEAVVAKVKALNTASWAANAKEDLKNVTVAVKLDASEAHAELDKLAAKMKSLDQGVIGKVLGGLVSLVKHGFGLAWDVTKFTGKLVPKTAGVLFSGLGLALSAPFKLAGLIPAPGIKLALGASLALGVLASVFAAYLHIEHNTERLIDEARAAAQGAVVTQYQSLSEELTRQQAQAHSDALIDLQASNAANEAKVDAMVKAFDDDQDAAQDAADARPNLSAHKKVKSHAKAHFNTRALNGADAGADRLLERRTQH